MLLAQPVRAVQVAAGSHRAFRELASARPVFPRRLPSNKHVPYAVFGIVYRVILPDNVRSR
jgi:hypothetical protein